jgi:hypothetical protein
MSKPSVSQNAQGLNCLELTYTEEWAIDALDRFLHGDLEGAKVVLSYANFNLMQMPPGSSYGDLEAFLCAVGVQIYQTLDEKSPIT